VKNHINLIDLSIVKQIKLKIKNIQMKLRFCLLFFVAVLMIGSIYAQNHDGHQHESDATEAPSTVEFSNDSVEVLSTDPIAAEKADAHDVHDHHATFDPGATAIHHISDGNVYTILDVVTLPLPMILYAPDRGWDFFSSGVFHSGHHEDGHKSHLGYVLRHGSVHRVVDPSFSTDIDQDITGFITKTENRDGKDIEIFYAMSGGKEYRLDARSTLDGGVLGGGITSFYDFSISKNVLSMILVSLFLFFIFWSAAKAYKKNPTSAPKGMQSLLETLFVFIRDEVAIPFIGKDKYTRFLPLLMSIFFFILGLNLFGQIPFFGSSNVTGNLTVTMIIALLVFIIVNINGNKQYWAHIFWMPGVPWPVKILLAAVEFMGLFIKPLTLMLRLAGNISAGHIAILSFIGLIFIFGKAGTDMMGSTIGTFMAIPLTLFMMAIELVVAFVQAFVFTLLTATYIGSAIEDAHHAEEHH